MTASRLLQDGRCQVAKTKPLRNSILLTSSTLIFVEYEDEYDEWRDSKELVDVTDRTENPNSDTDMDLVYVYSEC